MIVYRGTSTDALGILKGTSPEDLVGKTITEKAFMSTSTNSYVANGTFSGNMIMTIKAPKGSKGLAVSAISQYSNESEVLFQCGQKMIISDAKFEDNLLNIVVRLKK
ncbi:hypothetical protein SH1V18_18560 [Vallitalea longa]|uniref:ADP ribosyltransferase domain-containing protein n=2 Tax=Vallitalea longa TaxID=2936439 RepID=A0A9W5YB07_9FIRM|nr:hypothetical protein SH1V18_18560 [Vallitalea longa]